MSEKVTWSGPEDIPVQPYEKDKIVADVLDDGNLAEQQMPMQSPSFVVEASRGPVPLDLKSLWEYRELIYFFIWRDIKARYKQTAIGIAWAILQPFLTMVVFTVFFGVLAKIPSEGVPYPIFAYTALLPWQLFAGSLTAASSSLVVNQGLITKIYFPRLIVPLSSVFVGLLDFFIAFSLLVGLMFYYRIVPTAAVLALPVFILLALFTALAAGIWFSAINVQYRDVQQAIPFFVQFWMFITPIVYPLSLVPEKWRVLYSLNPMVGVIEGFRWALLGQDGPPDFAVLISLPVVISLFLGSLFYFRQVEKKFADVV